MGALGATGLNAALDDDETRATPSFDVRDYGAVGDDADDDAAALQAALDAAAAIGGAVRVPRGQYRTSKTLLVSSGVSVRGDGKGATTIKPHAGGGPATLMAYRQAADGSAANLSLEDFSLAGDRGTRRGLLLEGVSLSSFARLRIADLLDESAVGLEITSALEGQEQRNSADNNFYSLEIANCFSGVRLAKAASDSATFGPSFQNFYGLRVYGYTNVGFDLDAGEGVTAIAMRCTSDRDGVTHIRLNDDVPTLLAPCTDTASATGQTGIEVTPNCVSALILNPIGDMGNKPSNTRLLDNGDGTIVLRRPFTRLGGG